MTREVSGALIVAAVVADITAGLFVIAGPLYVALSVVVVLLSGLSIAPFLVTA